MPEKERIAGTWAWIALAWLHARREGVRVALAWLLRGLAARARWCGRRDPGERAAERFLRALGYEVLGRNWRSPRDPRDEADLIAATPDGTELAVVEVKRTASRWDPLDRVDGRKRSVLWRILCDLEEGSLHPGDARLRDAVRRARRIRIDLVGVRGDGATAVVVDYAPDVMCRELRTEAGPERRAGPMAREARPP